MYFYMGLNMIFGLINSKDQKYCPNLLHQKLTCLDTNRAYLGSLRQRGQQQEPICLDLFLIATLFSLQSDYLDLLTRNKILLFSQTNGNKWEQLLPIV